MIDEPLRGRLQRLVVLKRTANRRLAQASVSGTIFMSKIRTQVRPTSAGTTLMPRLAATTRNVASKVDAIMRYDTLRPSAAAAL